MNNLPPLKALQAFEAAGRSGSFQSAAKELCVTPSAISHQIKTLEKHLGLALFERQTRKISLTAVGQAYLDSISKSFARMEVATDKAISGQTNTQLKVAVAPMFLERWLLPRFADFADQFPEIEIEFCSYTDEINFIKSDVDMAIFFGDGDWGNVDTKLLRRASVIPVCAPELLEMEKVMDPEDLLHFRLLQIDNRPDDWQRWFRLSQTEFMPSQGAISFSNASLAVHAATGGAGVALAVTELVEDDLKNGLLMAPMELELELSKAYYLVYHKERPRHEVMIAFEDWIIKRLELSRQHDSSAVSAAYVY